MITTKKEMMALRIAWDDLEWHTAAEARSALQILTVNSTNAANHWVQDWDNHLLGGQFHEEDSPGNFLLRETNNQLNWFRLMHKVEKMRIGLSIGP